MDWELAGFTDEEGRLRADIPEQQGIIICPSVKQQGDNVIFAIPGDWTRPISALDKDIFDFLAADWELREDTSGLLEDVLDLAHRPHKVLPFAKKWGPLWVCCDGYHIEEYGDFRHWWKPEGRFGAHVELIPCKWDCAEKNQDYINFSKDLNTVLNIAAYLKQDKLVPPSVWMDFYGFEKDTIEGQKRVMIRFLSDLIGDIRLEINPDLTLSFTTGFGFRAAAYLQLVQVITGSPGLFVCDDCGKTYIRTGRKPARGKKNFCPGCGEGDKGSKRVWKRGRPKKPAR